MKLKYFELTPELLTELFIEGVHKPKPYKVIKGLPQDTRIIRIEFNKLEMINIIKVVVESEVFFDLEEGASIPRLDIYCKELKLKEEDND